MCRNYTAHIVWTLFTIISGTCIQAASAADRPNFLVLMGDNWAWPHAGILGDPAAQTPVFDRIANNGILFRNAFCLSPSCSPARAAFLTGQTIHRLRDAANLHGRFPADLTVFTEILEADGYQVGYSGKGWGPGNLKTSGRSRNPAGSQFATPAEFLAATIPDRPSFYWFSSQHAHLPWQAGSEHRESISRSEIRVPDYLPDNDVVRDDIRSYLCEVRAFDEECGDILRQFQAAGRLENTVVIMTSDNGWQMPHGLAHIYDAGTRIPLAVSWPGKIPQGAAVDDFANFDDLAPTILELAGSAALPDATGISLLPVLLQQERVPRQEVFLSRERHANVRRGDRSYPVRAIRTPDYLYVRNFDPDLWPAGDPEIYFAVGDYGDVDDTPTKRFLLANQQDEKFRQFFRMNFDKRPAEELYVLDSDPDQTINRVSDPQLNDIRRELADRLKAWMHSTRDPRAADPQTDFWDKAPYFGGPPRIQP